MKWLSENDVEKYLRFKNSKMGPGYSRSNVSMCVYYYANNGAMEKDEEINNKRSALVFTIRSMVLCFGMMILISWVFTSSHVK